MIQRVATGYKIKIQKGGYKVRCYFKVALKYVISGSYAIMHVI